MGNFDGTKLIMGAISIIIGLVMLPLLALFTANAIANSSVASIAGLSTLLTLIPYGFAFGLIGLGVGLIYLGFRK